ncbi:DUF3500 domain-containing protein [Mycobacterium colombiense]|uniref:DUF3500 domain-containing protein n=1 Tax=Mycobacterium colombiense TaxID=339268 RepID=UPI00200B975D|nr:DUF3500 domain-containing protein [Mycobacterium colombiense]MCK8646706.1 DUF3500 domain-containing protein [Mycobacterium colombiense]
MDRPRDGSGFSTTLGLISAMALFDALTTAQRELALLPFESTDRDNWDFLPACGRQGLPLRGMTVDQQGLLHQLVGECLRTEAYARVVATMNLEYVLRHLQASVFGLATHGFRDPFGYTFAFFGKPELEATWGWRLVGHHLSLNFTFVKQRWLAVTPMMFGAEPARFSTLRHLAEEEDLGFELLRSLRPSELEQAVIHPVSPTDFVTKSVRRIADEEHPGDHVTGRWDLMINDDDRKALKFMKAHPRGVSYGSMSTASQQSFKALLSCYIDRLKPDLAAREWQRIEQKGIDALHFAWAGGQDYDHGHYYRLQGPVTLIEFDNSEDNANHIHTVWRDMENDFGEDLLLEHVVQHHLREHHH